MCFSMEWIEAILIRLVIICAVVAIIKLLVPFVLSAIGAAGGVIAAAINICLWAVIAIFVIIVCFDLIQCIGGFSLVPHR